MPIDIPAVQRRPASIRPLDAVGDDQMGVQQRIAFSGRPVVEPNGQHPLSGHMLDTAMAAAGPQVSVQIGDRLAQPGMMGLEHRPAGGRIPKAVEDRDALGRPQHQVEGGHRVATMGTAQQLASCRVAALEHGLEPGHRCFALQPERGGAGAVPAAWGLAVARQVRLVVGGQLAGVIPLTAHRQLGDVGHHPAAPLPAFVGASERTRGALLFRRLRVERRASGEASSVMAGLECRSGVRRSTAVDDRGGRLWVYVGCRLWGDVAAARWR
jgi:hypothetical protein